MESLFISFKVNMHPRQRFKCGIFDYSQAVFNSSYDQSHFGDIRMTKLTEGEILHAIGFHDICSQNLTYFASVSPIFQ